jgi:hypothetical protein
MENAKELRTKMKAKAHRLANEKSEKVDASDWSPPEKLNAHVKTGMRPISRNAYKSGGKVSGEESEKRADKKPRTGNKPVTADSFANRDMKEANEEREGIKHIGGMKKGGTAKQSGGSVEGKLPERTAKDRMSDKLGTGLKSSSTGDGGTRYSAPDRAAMDDKAKAAAGMKKGGRTERNAGGRMKFHGDPVIPGMKKGGKAGDYATFSDQWRNESVTGKIINKAANVLSPDKVLKHIDRLLALKPKGESRFA